MKKEYYSRLLTLGLVAVLASFLFYSCSKGNKKPQKSPAANNELLSKQMVNQAAYIPSQCYTKTEDATPNKYNPCYSCHTNSRDPNYMSDPELQESYAFPEYARENHWSNLFIDRTAKVNAITDSDITAYVEENNYISGNTLLLAEKLKNVPQGWDFDADGKWSGYTPDCYYNFDTDGFDKDPSGNYTGWRAFGYYPFLGTFWPTNGSTDDVLIRLPEEMRKDASGNFSLEVYKINFAIVESVVHRKDVIMDAVNENVYGVDLDKNGSMGTATLIKYDWAPTNGKYMYYVGLAKQKQNEDKLHLAAGLFPEGTEFLHSVRYISTKDDTISLAPRMKELRYGKKYTWSTYADLSQRAQAKAKEKFENPDRLDYIGGDMEHGVIAGTGWVYQGFIEDKNGDLRPQTYEENVFCIGCHSNLGATTDTIFSFPRKFDSASAFQKGWYHWSQKGLGNIPEATRASDGEYEYAYYLMQNKAGDEFRANSEVIDKFFDGSGNPIASEFTALQTDISHLLFPSIARARTLNKAYKVIVQDQSFIYGRDATVTPPANVHATITQDQPTNVTVVPENRIQ